MISKIKRRETDVVEGRQVGRQAEENVAEKRENNINEHTHTHCPKGRKERKEIC
jgi:hypothetical protein